jgi:hypothetical protein
MTLWQVQSDLVTQVHKGLKYSRVVIKEWAQCWQMFMLNHQFVGVR